MTSVSHCPQPLMPRIRFHSTRPNCGSTGDVTTSRIARRVSRCRRMWISTSSPRRVTAGRTSSSPGASGEQDGVAWRGTDGASRRQDLRRTPSPADGRRSPARATSRTWTGWRSAGSASASAPRRRGRRSARRSRYRRPPRRSIGCFRIRPGYRRRGVASALLAGAVEAARETGAPGVEAYPIDPAGNRVEVGAASWASPRCSTPRASAGSS